MSDEADWTYPAYALFVPDDTTWEPETATAFAKALADTLGLLDLTIFATHERIRWLVYDYDEALSLSQMQQLVQAYYPKGQVEAIWSLRDLMGPVELPLWRRWLFRAMADDELAMPLRMAGDLKAHDPLRVVTQIMDSLRPNECLTYTLTLTESFHAPQDVIDNVLTMSALEAGEPVSRLHYRAGFMENFLHSASEVRRLSRKRVQRYTPAEERVIAAKVKGQVHGGFLWVEMDTPDKARLDTFNAVMTALGQFSAPPFASLLVAGDNYYEKATWLNNEENWRSTSASAVLNRLFDTHRAEVIEPIMLWLSPAEVAALWHLPYAGFTSRKIGWAGQSVPLELTGEQGERVCLGLASSRRIEGEMPVFLADADRAYHLYITGKTGMGKSTLMHNLIHQDIAAGLGVAVLDPHGKLIDDILAASIPAERIDDVVLLACGRSRFPVPLNPLRIPPGVSADTAFNYVYWMLRRIYEKVWSEGQMDRVLRNVLRTLLLDPEATPLDIQRILLHGGYRASLLDALKEHKMRASAMFWQDYSQKSEGMQMQIAQPILNRTEAFLGNPAMERMTCHPHALNFQDLIEDQKLVLINLAGESIRSEVGSLGAMFLAGFYMAFQALGYLPDGAPPRFFLYVDEVERYVTSPLPDMFSEARKFGLSLTLSNQYLDQLSSETLNGILGNVGTLLAFECGDKDARALASVFAPELDAPALQNLGAYQVAVKTRFQGRTLPAFTARTLRPPPPETGVAPAQISLRSLRANQPLSADDVDAWLDQRYYGDSEDVFEDGEETTDGLSDYE